MGALIDLGIWVVILLASIGVWMASYFVQGLSDLTGFGTFGTIVVIAVFIFLGRFPILQRIYTLILLVYVGHIFYEIAKSTLGENEEDGIEEEIEEE